MFGEYSINCVSCAICRHYMYYGASYTRVYSDAASLPLAPHLEHHNRATFLCHPSSSYICLHVALFQIVSDSFKCLTSGGPGAEAHLQRVWDGIAQRFGVKKGKGQITKSQRDSISESGPFKE